MLRMYGAEQPFRKWTGQLQKMLASSVWLYIWMCCSLGLLDCANSLSEDGVTLLNLRAAIESDPDGLLYDWKDVGTDPCTWKGVGCDHSARVVSLNLSSGCLCGRAGFLVDYILDRSGHFSAVSSASLQNLSSVCKSVECLSSQQSGDSCVPECCRRRSTAPYYRGKGISVRALTGYLSAAVGNLSQLRILSLPFNAFTGVLPKEIAALKFLEVLDLRGNRFSGIIPTEFGQLPRLKILNLAYNLFEGHVPAELSRCRNLQFLNLAGNSLSGNIPNHFGSLSSLQVLALSFNNLNGTISRELTRNCGNLEHVSLEDNFLSGSIPVGFGNCSRLRSFVVSSNFLSGAVPDDLGQLQMLQLLDVSRNSLGGMIPLQLGNCSQLSVLVLTSHLDSQLCGQHLMNENEWRNNRCDKSEYNYFVGIPAALMTLPKLQILWAPFAAVSGAFPTDWGNCQGLKVLNLAGNSISGNIPLGLAKCRNLIYLDLSSNRLDGNIPKELPISCMVVFNVSGNYLTGGLPSNVSFTCPMEELLNPCILPNPVPLSSDDLKFAFGFARFYYFMLYCGSIAKSLPVWFPTQGMPVIHDMSGNSLTGPLSNLPLGTSLVKRHPDYGLFISGNQLTGHISSSLFESCLLFQSLSFNLSKNTFVGELPAEGMVNCLSLRQFEAAFNHLTGRIPHGLGRLKHMVYLNLGMNKLSGELPFGVGQLQELRYLLLANNSLTGRIPKDLGRLTSLLRLDLSGNMLIGSIPEDLANLSQLRWLLLSNNYLSGSVPSNFRKLNHLAVMDVSFNSLSGLVPRIGKMETSCSDVEWTTGNEYLESHSAFAPTPSMMELSDSLPYVNSIAPRQKYHPNSIVIAAITSGCAIAAVLIILVVLFYFTKQTIPKKSGYRSGRKQLVMFRNLDVQLTYDKVVAATGNFSLNNLIGTGGFGATYKAELRPGLLVAVKKLSLGKFQGTQQFDAEIRTLGRIQHPNLVTLIGFHASGSQMFLIYNYLPGGNLENLLHDRKRGTVSWRVRYKIALNIAQALAYLHECTPRVLHRDIKPSNVLLDTDLNAFLSDFGLARLLGASETHATTDVAGTFGYVAPEYAMTCRLSDKADVYSFGVVLLELLSGKRALDQSFSEYGHGFNIVAWASQLFQKGKARDVFAPGICEQAAQSELYDVLKLAVKCTMVSLSVRPTMKQVVNDLKSVR